MSPTEKRVTIVGAGGGSLALAALLAKAGWRVRVFERASGPGGKACVRHEAGFTYDEGPSILILREVYDDLFDRLGLAPSERVAFQFLDPAFRIVGAEGSDFFLHKDFSETLGSIERGLAPAGGITGQTAARELAALVNTLDRFARVIGLSYADRAISSWLGFARPRLAASGLVVSPFSKYRAYVNARLSHPLLREFFYGFPGYAGFHPAEAPASLLLLPWQILRGGVFYPKGGVHAIVKAIEAAARRFGAEFRYGITVEGFERASAGNPGGAISALRTSEGLVNIEPGEQVVFGGCLGWLASQGAPSIAHEAGVAERWSAQSPSFFTVQTGLKSEECARAGLAHHTLILPATPKVSYQDYFDPGTPNPPRPPVYLNVPSVTDADVAPQGFANAFLVVSVPSRAGASDPAAHERANLAYARSLLGLVHEAFPALSASAFEGAPLYVKETARFAADLLQKGGQIYGPSLRTAQGFAGFARPHPRAGGARNLWFVGGGTQPGAGLPMVIQSGKIVAHELERAMGTRGMAAL